MVAPLMLTVAQAAELLGIGTRTAYSLIAKGEFPVDVRLVGRRLKISRVQLERFAAGQPLDGAPTPVVDSGPDRAHVPVGPATNQ